MKSEFVMVPRDLLVDMANNQEKRVAAFMPMISGAMNEQHQGEPVAWVVRWTDDDSLYTFTLNTARSERLRSDPDLVSTPLYTHADPGEVERLESLLRASRTSLDNCALQIEKLQAMLAERYALLRDIKNARDWNGSYRALEKRIDAALSASAEPERKPK